MFRLIMCLFLLAILHNVYSAQPNSGAKERKKIVHFEDLKLRLQEQRDQINQQQNGIATRKRVPVEDSQNQTIKDKKG